MPYEGPCLTVGDTVPSCACRWERVQVLSRLPLCSGRACVGMDSMYGTIGSGSAICLVMCSDTLFCGLCCAASTMFALGPQIPLSCIALQVVE